IASEFHVTAVPAMVFLRPDRTEFGRITGYRDADAFLAEAPKRLQGITALGEAKDAVAAAPSDAGKQKQVFSELARAGKHEAGVREHVAMLLKRAGAMLSRSPEQQRGDLLRMLHQKAIASAMPAFEALAGVGRVDDAMAVAKSVLGVDSGIAVREQLADAARR